MRPNNEGISIGATELSRERVLEMSPKELVDYFTHLEESGGLEAYLQRASKDDALVAMFSYWEKWLTNDQRAMVDDIVRQKKELYPGNSESLPLELEKRFTGDELEIIFSNLLAIQLTFGCSKGCPFCGFDAVPGVREHIPYSQLANMFQRFGKEIGESKPLLYYASEPTDYLDEDNTYMDVHQLAVEYAKYKPHVTSKNTDTEWVDFLSKKVNKPRISLFGVPEESILNLESLSAITGIKLEGRQKKHFEGLGVSRQKTEAPFSVGIGCGSGILITPRGLYNTLTLSRTSDRFPQGIAIQPFEKEDDNFDIKIGSDVVEIMKNTLIGKLRAITGFFFVRQHGVKVYVKVNDAGKVVDFYKQNEPWNRADHQPFFVELVDRLLASEKIAGVK